MTQSVKDAQAAVDALKQRIRDTHAQLDELRAQADTIADEYAQADDDLDTIAARHQDVLNRIALLDVSLPRLEARLSEASKAVTVALYHQIQADSDDLRKRIDDLDAKAQPLRDKLKPIQDEIDEAQSLLTRHLGRLADTTYELQRVHDVDSDELATLLATE